MPGAILCAPDPPCQLCPCASGADAQELEGIVSRAVRQAAQSLETAQVPEDVFWYAQQVGDTFLKHHFKAPCRLWVGISLPEKRRGRMQPLFLGHADTPQ